MEQHAIASNGEYYVYHLQTKEVKGPFFPETRDERIDTFVRETSARENLKVSEAEDMSVYWRGSYFRRMPAEFRAIVRGRAALSRETFSPDDVNWDGGCE